MTQIRRPPGSRRMAHPAVPIPADRIEDLIATAARAPSVHNTQPWRFRPSPCAIELHADQSRRLRADQAGREMLISCGAALFGLRLAVRELGYLPVVDLLPDQARPGVLARVALGEAAPMTGTERQMLAALPHRHTHRGPFSPGPLPAGLLAGLQHDARAEGAALASIDDPGSQRLADLAEMARRRYAADPLARAETRRWSHLADSPARDGVSARAFPAAAAPLPGRLPQRDFDLGRRIGLLAADGPAAAATAVLMTQGDDPADWLRAGQALHRVLIRAAISWVFASLHTQPLEIPAVRELIRSQLALPGHAQMLLQLGVWRSTRPTVRRPATELLIERRLRAPRGREQAGDHDPL